MLPEASTPKKGSKKNCKIEVPQNSIVVIVVVVTVVVIIVVVVIITVVVILAVARDNGAVLVKSLYPKEKEGQQRYYATRIVC